MPVTFQCITCQKSFTVSSKLAGKKIRCKGCNGITKVPDRQTADVDAIVPDVKAAPTAKTRPDDFVEIQTEWIVVCDDCGRKHRPDTKLLGKRVRCKCGSILYLTEHPDAGMRLAPLEPELADLPMDFGIQPVQPAQSGVYQAPPPSFNTKGTIPGTQRKRDAEKMVRDADEREQ